MKCTGGVSGWKATRKQHRQSGIEASFYRISRFFILRNVSRWLSIYMLYVWLDNPEPRV